MALTSEVVLETQRWYYRTRIGILRTNHQPIDRSGLTPASRLRRSMGQRARNRNPRLHFPPIVRVQYFVRGGFVGHRSRVSSKHLSSHLPVDGVRFLGGQKGVALQLQDARVGVGSTKDFDRYWEWLRYSSRPLL
ncbi:uncharacterized protein TNCV_901271 [Trichonephila clavipes]|nr:uncharacterized protein TNCV_901271 [Trichonephila clavipes]